MAKTYPQCIDSPIVSRKALEVGVAEPCHFRCISFAQRSTAFSILDRPFPQMRYALEWTTTTDATCHQPMKRTYHYLAFATPQPVTYKFLDASEVCPYWPEIGADNTHYLSYLMFGWTYILSCRWVEVLRDAGEQVFLRHSERLNHQNFWEIVTGPRWEAVIVRGGDIFHAPWSLATSDARPPYVRKLSVRSTTMLTLGFQDRASKRLPRLVFRL